ncbi:hypothetical protein MMC30_001442 [Trapelia coarctata]|nr:hypothetical protein [Trapelia coarctata]
MDAVPKEPKSAKPLLTLEEVNVYAEELERMATFWKAALKHEETCRLKDVEILIYNLKAGHAIDGKILELQCDNIKFVNDNPTSIFVFPAPSMSRLEKLRERKRRNLLRLQCVRESIRDWHIIEKSTKAIMKQEREDGQNDLKRLRHVLRKQERDAAAAAKKRAAAAKRSRRVPTNEFVV